jgi:hypothetical protein
MKFSLKYIGFSSLILLFPLCKPVQGDKVANVGQYKGINAANSQFCGKQETVKKLKANPTSQSADAAIAHMWELFPYTLQKFYEPFGGKSVFKVGLNNCTKGTLGKSNLPFESCYELNEQGKLSVFLDSSAEKIHAHMLRQAFYAYLETILAVAEQIGKFEKDPTSAKLPPGFKSDKNARNAYMHQMQTILYSLDRYHESMKKDPNFKYILENFKTHTKQDPTANSTNFKVFLMAEALDSFYCSQEQVEYFQKEFPSALEAFLNSGIYLGHFGGIKWTSREELQKLLATKPSPGPSTVPSSTPTPIPSK